MKNSKSPAPPPPPLPSYFLINLTQTADLLGNFTFSFGKMSVTRDGNIRIFKQRKNNLSFLVHVKNSCRVIFLLNSVKEKKNSPLD